eukprot:SM000041S15421  [mRNA]  locus=s41:66692:67803:+ [translate_table: standard]
MRASLQLSTLRRHSAAPWLAALGACALQWPRALSAKGGAAAPPAAKGAKKARGPSGEASPTLSLPCRFSQGDKSWSLAEAQERPSAVLFQQDRLPRPIVRLRLLLYSGPEASLASKELREAYVVGANILKDGSDPPVQPDSEYPDWLWHLLDKQAPLSELKRKDVEKLDEKEFMRLRKLDNRRDIKEKNASRAKG